MNVIYKNSDRLLNTNNIVSGDENENENKTVNNLVKENSQLQHTHSISLADAQTKYTPLILALTKKRTKYNIQQHNSNTRTLYLDGINPSTAYTNTNTLKEQTDIDNLNTIINSINPITKGTSNSINDIINNTSNNTIANKYKIITYIGRGINGKLYMAHDKHNNKVICKQITVKDTNTHNNMHNNTHNNTYNNTHQSSQIQFELQILKYLHNNITTRDYINPCLDHKIVNNNVYTFFPIFNGYSLIHFRKYLSKLPHLTYYNLVFYLIKLILHGMAQIHKANISHQNITENSILVSSNTDPKKLYIKFTDFGLGCGSLKPHNLASLRLGQNSNTVLSSSCIKNTNVPIIINNNIKSQLTDTSYLQLSQHFDILALGIIFLKLLLHRFETIDIDISKGYNNNVKKILNNIINKYTYVNSKTKKHNKHNKHNKHTYTQQSVLETPFIKLNTLDNVNKKKLIRNITNYLKLFSKYIFCNTNDRQPLHYILDKIIIYEKYNN